MANTTDDTEKNNQDEDNFGLPEIEYKPLDELNKPTNQEAEPVKDQEESYQSSSSREDSQNSPVYDDEEEERSSAPVVISIIIGLVVLVAGFMIYKYVYKPKQEKARLEQIAKEKEAADKKAEEERLAKLAEEERLKKEAEANAKPAEGAIETLSQRTGHYYVIISSSVDGDLAMDRAKKLSAKGIGSKIIPPFGKWKFYRLGIGDFDSFASAQSNADASKSEYGDALWVMKY
jgi:hypothetical protein